MRAAALCAAARRPPQPLLLALSACAWLVLALAPHALLTPQIVCGSGAPGSSALALAILFAQPPLVSWLLMLIAMMLPLLARPLTHVWSRSLARRRWNAIAMFLIGYALTWTAAGAVLALLAILLRANLEPRLTLVLALVTACAWRVSPAWQACQNRCHRVPRLDAFGLAVDCLFYGARSGVWCVATCWALMLMPLLGTSAHLPVMLGAAVAAFVDRQAPPRPARWTAWPRVTRTASGSTRSFATPTTIR